MTGVLNRITPSMYDGVYLRKSKNNFLNRLDFESIGAEIGKLKCAGFLSKGDPKRYRQTLLKYSPADRIGNGTLLDLGCGFGLLGLWLAEQLHLKLVGIDFSSVAIAHANAAAKELAHTGQIRASFRVADFQATGLRRESITAVFSHDAFYLATDPLSALNEVQRILVRGGPLLFTAYVPLAAASRLSLHRRNWVGLLESAGFETVQYKNVTSRWRKEMRRKHERRWSQRKRVEEELGLQGQAELAVSMAMLGLNGKPPFLQSVSRYEVVARRR